MEGQEFRLTEVRLEGSAQVGAYLHNPSRFALARPDVPHLPKLDLETAIPKSTCNKPEVPSSNVSFLYDDEVGLL